MSHTYFETDEYGQLYEVEHRTRCDMCDFDRDECLEDHECKKDNHKW